MKVLTTFSGKFGDILWSLPTVRQISKNHGVKVDMGIMPMYKSLVPMLKTQTYLEDAYAIDNWFCEGSPFGDQPWNAPLTMLPKQYDLVYHLTYREHPHMPLIDYIARQQGLVLDEPVCPFIDTHDFPPYRDTYIAYAFNTDYKELKDQFFAKLQAELATDHMGGAQQIRWVDVSKADWFFARYIMKYAIAFVGCRSANYVLAHGIGHKHIITYEPHPHRNSLSTVFGNTFSNPHNCELHFPVTMSPESAATNAAQQIRSILSEKLYAIA